MMFNWFKNLYNVVYADVNEFADKPEKLDMGVDLLTKYIVESKQI